MLQTLALSDLRAASVVWPASFSIHPSYSSMEDAGFSSDVKLRNHLVVYLDFYTIKLFGSNDLPLLKHSFENQQTRMRFFISLLSAVDYSIESADISCPSCHFHSQRKNILGIINHQAFDHMMISVSWLILPIFH